MSVTQRAVCHWRLFGFQRTNPCRCQAHQTCKARHIQPEYIPGVAGREGGAHAGGGGESLRRWSAWSRHPSPAVRAPAGQPLSDQSDSAGTAPQGGGDERMGSCRQLGH